MLATRGGFKVALVIAADELVISHHPDRKVGP
jgi:hypothetical protein